MHTVKRMILFSLIVSSLFLSLPMSISAHSYSPSELVDIVNPYINETYRSYELINEEELISRIGWEAVESLKVYLVEASRQKAKSMRRDAVQDYHTVILREAGATVQRYWWGTRIKTNTRPVAINVRNLSYGFSGDAGTEGMLTALTLAGIGFIPGYGTAATVVGMVVGVVSWADSTTWSNVSMGVANKVDLYQYKLTIDINKWIMEVKVYPHD